MRRSGAAACGSSHVSRCRPRGISSAWGLTITPAEGWERCGTTSNLQAHHIIKKSQSAYLSVDLENGLCLCGKCHIGWWHYDEVRARGWLDAYKGPAFYEGLSARRHLRRTNWAEIRAELQVLVDQLGQS